MLAADRQSRDLKKLVALMIGFFVSTVFVRWWSQFTVRTHRENINKMSAKREAQGEG